MFLKKVLNQPNLVGTVMIALLVCSGFVYAFAFDGFNVETATGGEVEAWLAQAGGGGSGGGNSKCACLGPLSPCGCPLSSSYSCIQKTCPLTNSLCSVDDDTCNNNCQVKCSVDLTSNGSGWCVGNCGANNYYSLDNF